jgi:hypothetical protein
VYDYGGYWRSENVEHSFRNGHKNDFAVKLSFDLNIANNNIHPRKIWTKT